MTTDKATSDEILDANDEVFSDPSALPALPPEPEVLKPEEIQPLAEETAAELAPALPLGLPVKDYVRQLQDEFMQQEDEGKL